MAIATEVIATQIQETAVSKTEGPGAPNAGDAQHFNNIMAEGNQLGSQSVTTVTTVSSVQAPADSSKATIGDKLLDALDGIRNSAAENTRAVNDLLSQPKTLTVADTFTIQHKMNSMMIMFELVGQVANNFSKHTNTLLTAQ